MERQYNVQTAEPEEMNEEMTDAEPKNAGQQAAAWSGPQVESPSAIELAFASAGSGNEGDLQPTANPIHLSEAGSEITLVPAETSSDLTTVTGRSAQSSKTASTGVDPAVIRAASEQVEVIIHNELPIHLIYIPKGTIKGRTAVWKMVERDVIRKLKANETWEQQEEDIRKYIRRKLGYAILSHRWLPDGEVSFEDIAFRMPSGLALDCTPEGRHKWEQFCQKARDFRCDWAWADTCCIDKRSSAELDESIRSMYRWYLNAKVCIVHLRDTQTLEDFGDDGWFKRGWTLQELLAPRFIKFYNALWEPLRGGVEDLDMVKNQKPKKPSKKKTGKRDVRVSFTGTEQDSATGRLPGQSIERNIAASQGSVDETTQADINAGIVRSRISEVTGIPEEYLKSFEAGVDLIREKMVWVSRRKTTRVEDMAYSLVGLFNIDLQIAYGEGEKAFYRLQRAIMDTSAIEDLFIWQGPRSITHSMLAKSPTCFAPVNLECPLVSYLSHRCKHLENYSLHAVQQLARAMMQRGGRGFPLTNAGLCIELVMHDVKPITKKAAIPMEGESEVEVEVEAVVQLGPAHWRMQVETLGSVEIKSQTMYPLHEGLYFKKLRLGVMDYERDDAHGKPDAFKEELYNPWNLYHSYLPKNREEATPYILKGRTERWYTAKLLHRPVPGPNRPYEAIETEDIILVHRPSGGWRTPETIYVK